MAFLSGINDWFKKRLQQTENVGGRVVAQINPLDNGRTYQTSAPQPMQQESAFHQLTHNGVTNGAGQIIAGTANWAAAAPKFLYSQFGRIPAASFTGNTVARQQAVQARNNAETTFGAPLFRPLVQAAETAVHPFTQHTFAPASTNEQRLLSKTPIQNINAGVASNYNAHSNLPGLSRAVLAGLYGFGQVAQDAGSVAGTKAAITDVAKPAAAGAAKGAAAAKAYNAAHGESGMVKIPGVNQTSLIEQIKAKYKGTATTPEEKQALNYVLSNPDKAMADYNARTVKEFGVSKPNIVAGDDAKFVVSGEDPLRQKLDGTKSAAYHEPASALAKVKYDQLLSDPTTADRPVLLMAGGSGAGKTSGLKQVLKSGGRSLDDYAAVIDTNSNALAGADTKIQQALQSGRRVEVAYVYRDPVTAFEQGVIPRAKKIGRIVPVQAHLDTHLGSNEVIHQLSEKYKDNPNVQIGAVDNSGAAGTAKFVPVDQIPKLSYNIDKLRAKLERAVHNEHQQGTISDAERQTYLGTQGPTAAPDLGSAGGQPQLPEPGQVTPSPGLKVVQNRLTKGGKDGRQNLSPEVQARISGDHVRRNTQQLQDRAIAAADSKSIDEVINKAHEDLAVAPGRITDETVANAQQAIERADAAGRKEDAAAIHDALSEHLVKSGQTIQAASLLYNLSPENLAYRGERTLKKAGIEITPALKNKLDTARGKVKEIDATLQKERNAANGQIRASNPESVGKIAQKRLQQLTEQRDKAVKEYSKVVSDALPVSTSDKLTAIWKAGLLTGIRTQTGNALSNETFGALHAVSNPLAVIADKAMSLATGKRTKTLTGKGLVSGRAEGYKKGYAFMNSGVDERRAITNKFDQSEVKFKNPVLNTYVNGVFRLMGAADRPAYYGQLRNSLYDLAKADGINKGLKGNDLVRHIQSTIVDPPKKMFQTATNEAEKAVLGNDTFLSNAASSVRMAAGRQKNPLAREAAKTVVNVVAPFTKVPSAFLSRVFDFTPVGAVKEAAQQIAAKKLDQRALSTAIGEAGTGTALIYLGVKLAQNGLLSGAYPTDPKEQARWKAQGIQPNSVKVGNKWYSMNYFGPLGLLFGAGSRVHDVARAGGGLVQQTGTAIVGGIQDTLGQSFVQGVSGLSDAIKDPKRYALQYGENLAGSAIPTLSNDIGTAIDPNQREVNNPGQAIVARIPGARQTLPVKQDVYGTSLAAKANPLSALLNPFRPSDALSNKVTSEVERLHATDPGNGDLQVTPTPLKKVVSFNGVSVTLSDQQRHDLQHAVGQATQQAWGQLIATPEYKALSDPQKAAALLKLRTDATEIAKRKFSSDNQLGQYGPNFQGKGMQATKSQQAIMDGSVHIADYATQAQKSGTVKIAGGGTPKDKYEAALKQFNQDVKDNKLSPVEKELKQQSLNRQKVTSAYSADANALYSQSATTIRDYLIQHPDNSLANQIVEIDQKLYQAGIIAKPKLASGSSTTSTTAKKAKGVSLKGPGISRLARSKTLAFKISGGRAPSNKLKRIAVRKFTTHHVAKISTKKAIRLA